MCFPEIVVWLPGSTHEHQLLLTARMILMLQKKGSFERPKNQGVSPSTVVCLAARKEGQWCSLGCGLGIY